MSPIEVLDRRELQDRRRSLLQALPIPVEELRRRARDYQTTAEELAALSQLDELDFLLGR